jgi:general secretion pathway protein H
VTGQPRRARGFTLVEVLVVLVIIGVLLAVATLSLGVTGGDREVDRERERLAALLDLAREEASVQVRELGLRVTTGGYEFMAYDAVQGIWQVVTDDPSLRARQWPDGLAAALRVEDRAVVLPKAEDDTEEEDDGPAPVPQVLLFSSGETNLFELTVRRGRDGPGFRLAPSENEDRIEAATLEAGSR